MITLSYRGEELRVKNYTEAVVTAERLASQLDVPVTIEGGKYWEDEIVLPQS